MTPAVDDDMKCDCCRIAVPVEYHCFKCERKHPHFYRTHLLLEDEQ